MNTKTLQRPRNIGRLCEIENVKIWFVPQEGPFFVASSRALKPKIAKFIPIPIQIDPILTKKESVCVVSMQVNFQWCTFSRICTLLK